MSVRFQTSQNVDVEYELASIGDRILANLVDYLIYFGWVLAAGWLFSVSDLKSDLSTFFIILGVVLPILFYPLLTEYFLNGQTLGKRAMKIRVLRLDGSKPTLGGYILRWLLIVIDCQLFTPLVAVVAVAAGGKGQRFGDIAAGTTVVKTRTVVSLNEVIYQPTADDYRVTYPDAASLTDRDVETIRQVLRKQNPVLLDHTANRVSNVLNTSNYTNARHFLTTVINDYAHLANQER